MLAAMLAGMLAAATAAAANPDPSWARAQALVAKMTLDEKVNQLLSEAPAIPRLGIGRYQYWGEALHGQIGPGTTVFPQVRIWTRGGCVHRKIS